MGEHCFPIDILDNNIVSNNSDGINLKIIDKKINLPLRSIDLEKVSKSLKEYVDFNVDPCDDFHKFTCKKWLNYNSNEKNDIINGENEIIVNKFKIFEKKALRGDLNHMSDAIEKINKIYQKCEMIKIDYSINCTEELRNFALYAVASIYLNNEIKNKNIENDYVIVQEMINKIKNQFKILINEKKNLFDEESRNNFILKVNNMILFRKFHEELNDISLMEECYKYIQFEDNNNFDVIKEKLINYKSLIFENEEMRNKCLFYLQTNKSLEYNFIDDLVDDEATYSRDNNYFIINPLMLVEPYFSEDYPDSLNYGGLGVVIGHEIIHGFDNEGVYYDYFGKSDTKMISEISEKIYKQKSECFEEQYGNEIDIRSDVNINGSLTLNENIADNGGIKIAYRALIEYLKSINFEEPKIPGFENYTSEKLFFINFGRSLCEKSREEIINKRPYKDGPHSTVNLRVIKTLNNFKPFSKAFNCKVGTNMNLNEKCELW